MQKGWWMCIMGNEKDEYKDEYIEGLYTLDDIFPLVIPDQKPFPWNLHKLDAYCKKKGIDPSQLTDEELKQFEIKK